MNDSKIGYVIMLDVLGYRDFASKNIDVNFIDIWRGLIRDLRCAKDKLEKEYGRFIGIDFMFLSDTILIGVYAKPRKISFERNVIAFIPSLIKTFLYQYMTRSKLFFRGAISFGEFIFSSEENIVMGSAIDEVSEWYESSEWIGIVLTPSAEYSLMISIKDDRLASIKSNLINDFVRCDIPFKSGFPNLCNFAINWLPECNTDEERNEQRISILKAFSEIRHSPKYSIKYINTIKFVDSILKINNDYYVIDNS